MKSSKWLLCLALSVALAGSVQAQIRKLPATRQQFQNPGIQMQSHLQPVQMQQPGNYQVQGNIIYGRQPSWIGDNTMNGQLMPPLGSFNPYATPAFPQMNPYATSLSPLANPYANPLSPYNNALSPFANPLLNPMVNPYAAGNLNPLLNPYPTNSAQALYLQQLQLNAYQQQWNPMNPLAPNTPAPIVGAGRSGFAIGR